MKIPRLFSIVLVCVIILFSAACKEKNMTGVTLDSSYLALEGMLDDTARIVRAEYTGETKKVSDYSDMFLFRLKEVIAGDEVEETFALILYNSHINVDSTTPILTWKDFKTAGEEYILFLDSETSRKFNTAVYYTTVGEALTDLNDVLPLMQLSATPSNTFESSEDVWSYVIDYIEGLKCDKYLKELPYNEILNDYYELTVVDLTVKNLIRKYDRASIWKYECEVIESVSGKLRNNGIIVYFTEEMEENTEYTVLMKGYDILSSGYKLAAKNSFYKDEATSEKIKSLYIEQWKK